MNYYDDNDIDKIEFVEFNISCEPEFPLQLLESYVPSQCGILKCMNSVMAQVKLHK
jgi:hypothetical protein